MADEKNPKKKFDITNKLDELKNRLYSATPKISDETRTKIKGTAHMVSEKWKTQVGTTKKKAKKYLVKSSVFKKFFLFSIGFFVIAAIFGLISVFGTGNTVSPKNIEINVLGNAFTSGGETLPLQVQIINKNRTPLQFSDLIVEYQKGSGEEENFYSERFGVGEVPAGKIVEETIDVLVFGQQGTTRDINFTLEYRVPGSVSIFTKSKIFTVNISSAPVNLLINGPESTSPNQDISFEIEADLNTAESVEDMMVVISYPPGFDFDSATPSPTFSNNIWYLGDLNPGSQKKIKIDGKILAQASEQRAFNVYIGSQDQNNDRQIGTYFNSQSYLIAIEQPFLDLRLALDDKYESQISINGGSKLDGEIEWVNNSSEKLTDIEVEAVFSGGAFDIDTLSSSRGFVDVANNKVVWNKSVVSDLGEIDPGEEGVLLFELTPKSTNISNPEVAIDINISGKQPSAGAGVQTVNGIVRKVARIFTNLQVAGHALYYSGPINNTGPIPPEVGEETTYTVVWSVANPTNTADNVEVRTKLPIYVDWTSNYFPVSENVTYNASSREVIWRIGKVNGGVGFGTLPKELNFQVRFNPTNSHVNKVMPLTEGVEITGIDGFANTEVFSSINPIRHKLDRDINYNPLDDAVDN